MNWRLDLADRPLGAVCVLEGEPRLVAVWTSPHEIEFLSQANGAWQGRLRVPLQATDIADARWATIAQQLIAPTGAWLSGLHVGEIEIHTTYDGRMRLYVYGGRSRATIELDGQQVPLTANDRAPIRAAAMDRELGTIALLRDDASVELYQQHTLMRRFSIADVPEPGFDQVLLADMAGSVLLVGAAGISQVDFNGHVRARLETHGDLQVAACSSDGALIVTGDSATGAVRVYDADLNPLAVGMAWAIWDGARPLGLVESIPSRERAIGGVDIGSDGTLVLTLGGGVCCTQIDRLEAPASPRLLL